MSKNLNNKNNRFKFIAHGVFYHGAVTAADPSTILPLLVSYFGQAILLLGFSHLY